MTSCFITELNVRHREQIERLLNHEPSFNGFVLSDLVHGDFASDYVRILGEIKEGDLKSVLIIFNDKMVYYAPDDAGSVHCYADCVNESKVQKLVGKQTLIEKFEPFVEHKGHTDCYVCELTTFPNPVRINNLTIRTLSTRQEAAQLYDLFVQVEEYGFSGSDKESYIHKQLELIQQDSVRTFFADVDGNMVATAAYLNDRPNTAIIIGVATPPQFRNRGYASSVLYQLCSEAIRAGKVLYLFYTNPNAGSVYRRLGFGNGGAWRILNLV